VLTLGPSGDDHLPVPSMSTVAVARAVLDW